MEKEKEKTKIDKNIDIANLSSYDAIKNISNISRIMAIKKIKELKIKEKKMKKTEYFINNCKITVYGKELPTSIINKLKP
jgi:hypothetical protein